MTTSDADKIQRLAESVVDGEMSLGDAVLALPTSDADKHSLEFYLNLGGKMYLHPQGDPDAR